MSSRRKLAGGVALVTMLLGFAGNASAGTHALADRTYYGTVPKTNVAVLVKTDPIPKNKPGGGAAKTGVVAIECGVHLARVNPRFAFTPRGSFFRRTDWFFSTWGNTGNGTFDAVGKVLPLSGQRIKVTLGANQVPTCSKVRTQAVTLGLAGRKVTQRLASELAQGVHTPASIAPTCPASSVFGQQVAVGGRLSPDTGGTGVTIIASNSATPAQLDLTTVPTAADGSFTYRFTPSLASGPAYTETVRMNFPGGWGRDPTSAVCSWQVSPAPPVIL